MLKLIPVIVLLKKTAVINILLTCLYGLAITKQNKNTEGPAQYLERHALNTKIAGSIPIWDNELRPLQLKTVNSSSP